MQDKIIILMATYNGEEYISKQLDSLIEQTYENWELWIRDDFSTDTTIEIIQKYISVDNRIHIYNDKLGNLGATRNFATLLENVNIENYVMFADQDDFWLPFKIELTLRTMKENVNNTNEPSLVYSPLTKVNALLEPIKIKEYPLPKKTTINNIISQNYIYGCTMMLNKELVKLTNPISGFAENHDYWIALIAASHGKVFSTNKSTILYRQHDNNVSGSYKDSSYKLRIKRLTTKKYNIYLIKKLNMLDALTKHLNSKGLDISFYEEYLSTIKKGGFMAVVYVIKNKLFKHGTNRVSNLMNLITIFNYKDNR